MPQTLTLLTLVLAFTLPLLLTVWWPGRRWQFAILLVGVILSGWCLIVSEALVHKYARDADIYERASLGLPVTQAEYMDDGVGDNAAALLLGWIVPALGAGLGWAVTAVRSRASRARGFPVVAVTSDGGSAAA
jgi:hypothetical protein